MVQIGDRVEALDRNRLPTGKCGTVSRVLAYPHPLPPVIDVRMEDGTLAHHYADYFRSAPPPQEGLDERRVSE